MNNFGASEEGSIQTTKGHCMYYPHPLIARHMRQFPLLRQPWHRYETTYDPVAKAFEKRQYRKAERAYRLMADVNQPAERQGIIGRVGQLVHAIWDAVK
jgi:hypothetical protein